VFHTVGVDPMVEFVAASPERRGPEDPGSVTLGFRSDGSLQELLRRILEHYRFGADYEDLERDVSLMRRAIEAELRGSPIAAVELARPVFFRGKGAYLVGKARTAEREVPLVLALTNPSGRIVVDAVLLTEDEASIVFSFARTYFFVDLGRPRDLVEFLRTIMPRKPVGELYNAVGCDKHGKTELYRSLLHHLEVTDDRFAVAPGQRGMVMCVFTLPRFDVVFKVMRDRFDYPKMVTHEEVRQKYRLVFRHDRAGRLVDAQEFEHMRFDRRRFDERLLDELTSLASETVTVEGDRVVIRHLYTERRLTPLDVYLKTATPEKARRAVLDYGQVLRDLAATNIFPGDMLLKNFGVSRHGRLIFYDYDELCLLTECRFRELPPPREDCEEGAPEPWFHVGERDIFPEEFRAFLGLKGDLLEAFLAAHGELLSVPFWHRMQEKHRNGEVLDIYPYMSARRLRRSARRREKIRVQSEGTQSKETTS
jgi:isocitrate dehydrogenase kinase/phosphatase